MPRPRLVASESLGPGPKAPGVILKILECAAKIQNCYLSCSASLVSTFPAPESTDTNTHTCPSPLLTPFFFRDLCPCLDGDTSIYLDSDQASVRETWDEESTSWVSQDWLKVTPEAGGQRLCSDIGGWMGSPCMSPSWWGAGSGVL